MKSVYEYNSVANISLALCSRPLMCYRTRQTAAPIISELCVRCIIDAHRTSNAGNANRKLHGIIAELRAI